MLLAHGAEVNKRDIEGKTPFFRSCERGLPVIAKMLLDSGADDRSADARGTSPIHVACRDVRHPEVLGVLLTAGSVASWSGPITTHESAIYSYTNSSKWSRSM
jgi:ankyrin repeat protein